MTTALVDERISYKCERELLIRGFHTVRLPAQPTLQPPIASHPDTLLFYHDNEIITSADYCERAPYVFSDLRVMYPDIKITFTEDILGNEYPKDVPFNALALSDMLFARENSLSPAVARHAAKRGMKIVGTKQGYPACATLALSQTAVITADEGLKKTYEAHGIDVTLIRHGGITLAPYEYGFIGGASGVFCDKVYFLGDYTTHPNYKIIEEAIYSHGMTPVSLSDEPLADLGGIVFIK